MVGNASQGNPVYSRGPGEPSEPSQTPAGSTPQVATQSRHGIPQNVPAGVNYRGQLDYHLHGPGYIGGYAVLVQPMGVAHPSYPYHGYHHPVGIYFLLRTWMSTNY